MELAGIGGAPPPKHLDDRRRLALVVGSGRRAVQIDVVDAVARQVRVAQARAVWPAAWPATVGAVR